MNKPKPPVECLTYSAEQFAKALGISRGKLYEALSSGALPLPSIRIGRRPFWLRTEVAAWLAAGAPARARWTWPTTNGGAR